MTPTRYSYRNLGRTALAALAMACTRPVARYTPPALPASPAERLQHAAEAGTLAAVGQPTGESFVRGLGISLILGPVGTAIAVATTDADPPDVRITPPPAYADTSAAYLLAFRQAYDAQVRSDRRGAALAGGILGAVTSAIVIISMLRAGND